MIQSFPVGVIGFVNAPASSFRTSLPPSPSEQRGLVLPSHQRLSAGGMTQAPPPAGASPSGGPDHAALIEAIALRRDRDAFAQLFAWFGPRVKACMLRAGIDPAAAEELAQEIMLAVWQKAACSTRHARPRQPGFSPSRATCGSTPCGAPSVLDAGPVRGTGAPSRRPGVGRGGTRSPHPRRAGRCRRSRRRSFARLFSRTSPRRDRTGTGHPLGDRKSRLRLAMSAARNAGRGPMILHHPSKLR